MQPLGKTDSVKENCLLRFSRSLSVLLESDNFIILLLIYDDTLLPLFNNWTILCITGRPNSYATESLS